MDNPYDAKEVEKKLNEFWENDGIYAFDLKSFKKIFSIDSPPPTVSGKMHIGHAFSYAQMDFIARYKRMRGFNIFYPFGTDNNGLATERLIEKMKNVKGRNMPREKFIELCNETLKEILPDFIQDWKNIGISADYSIAYSTIDERCRKLSQKSFIDIHKIGRAYRKKAPTMWCPECQTAIAQVELKDKEIDSIFNHILFKCEDENLIIATTRPELLPSCVAVFANPLDERYKKYFGKKAKVPLFNFEVPIMADERASMEKGTGIVMCCTFGDQTDIEWQKAHKLPIKLCLDEAGKLNKTSGKYSGMKIKEARKEIIEDLKKEKLLIKQEPLKHFVNVHERCNTEIEFIVSKQWFVRYLDLKEQFLKQGNKVDWHPSFMKSRYDNWIKGLQWDWCISRQRFFGVPFPVWYCYDCGAEILADKNQLPVDPLTDLPPVNKCPHCNSTKFIPEKDVMDTWATSSLTPQIAIDVVKQKFKFAKLRIFPMSLRPQAHEIITFWAFNTIVKSWLHEKKKPWKNIMISGFITLGGKKMSKSLGNTIEPRDVLDKYNADALRSWAANSKLGEDTEYVEKDLIAGKKTINKLWNASNFVFSFITEEDKKIIQKKPKLELLDKAILSKLNELIKNSTKNLNEYEYSKAKGAVEIFFWQTFCDNYLEIVKNRLYNENIGEKGKRSAKYTLYKTLLEIIKMLAPFMPYITEEIYQKYYKETEKEKSIHISKWPKYNFLSKSKKAEKTLDSTIEIITKVRQEKSKNQKSMKIPINLSLNSEQYSLLENILEDLRGVCQAKEIKKAGVFNIELLESEDENNKKEKAKKDEKEFEEKEVKDVNDVLEEYLSEDSDEIKKSKDSEVSKE